MEFGDCPRSKVLGENRCDPNVMIMSKHPLPPPMHAPCHTVRAQKSNKICTLVHVTCSCTTIPRAIRPPRAPIQMTQAIVEVARALGIAVHDHLIVGKDGHASLKALKHI
jgi:RadC-like JAB domain